MIDSLVVGVGVLVLANLAPPPLSTSAFLSGPLTTNGIVNAVGRLALLRIFNGTLKKGQTVAWVKRDGAVANVMSGDGPR